MRLYLSAMSHATVGAALMLACAACGSSNAPLKTASTAISAEVIGVPSVVWDDAAGATTVVVKFSARARDNAPLGPNDIDVQMLVDNAPLDNESQLQQDAHQLEIDLHYTLVLDATYSMMLHDPPAFEPMKAAAKKSVEAGERAWKTRPGSFNWDVTWFDDDVYRPEGAWNEANILAIPAPQQGSFTRLYAAVDSAISRISQQVAALNPASRAKRHDVMVVFSDGKDNHSWHGNAELDALRDLDSGLKYREVGWPGTTLDNVLNDITASNSFTLHTIGMGSDINEVELAKLASTGHGIFVKNPGTAGIATLFERVSQEFNTIQTRGATIPNPSGDYTFTVLVRQRDTNGEARINFRIHAGDTSAKLL